MLVAAAWIAADPHDLSDQVVVSGMLLSTSLMLLTAWCFHMAKIPPRPRGASPETQGRRPQSSPRDLPLWDRDLDGR